MCCKAIKRRAKLWSLLTFGMQSFWITAFAQASCLQVTHTLMHYTAMYDCKAVTRTLMHTLTQPINTTNLFMNNLPPTIPSPPPCFDKIHWKLTINQLDLYNFIGLPYYILHFITPIYYRFKFCLFTNENRLKQDETFFFTFFLCFFSRIFFLLLIGPL